MCGPSTRLARNRASPRSSRVTSATAARPARRRARARAAALRLLEAVVVPARIHREFCRLPQTKLTCICSGLQLRRPAPAVQRCAHAEHSVGVLGNSAEGRQRLPGTANPPPPCFSRPQPEV
eukprot:254171-Chlamydomonas_euryale.AAC.5